MATFKVGQRVRKVKLGGYTEEAPVGTTGTILPQAPHAIGDELTWEPDTTRAIHYVHPWQLAPLTDGEADTWAAGKVRELVKTKPMDVERVKEPACL